MDRCENCWTESYDTSTCFYCSKTYCYNCGDIYDHICNECADYYTDRK